MELFGVRLIGLDASTGHKALLTIALLAALWLVRSAAAALLGRVDASGDRASRVAFWTRQGVSLVVAACAAIGFVSIWFDNPANLTTAIGLVTAGLAFALQKVITALAGYFVILRGSTFTVGDRIVMGGVRGDFRVRREDFAPAVYWRLTDNWLELTLRFIAHDHGTREMKDAMSREVLAKLDQAGVGIASTTLEITALPEVRATLAD